MTFNDPPPYRTIDSLKSSLFLFTVLPTQKVTAWLQLFSFGLARLAFFGEETTSI